MKSKILIVLALVVGSQAAFANKSAQPDVCQATIALAIRYSHAAGMNEASEVYQRAQGDDRLANLSRAEKEIAKEKLKRTMLIIAHLCKSN